jgi:hypothetical protein
MGVGFTALREPDAPSRTSTRMAMISSQQPRLSLNRSGIGGWTTMIYGGLASGRQRALRCHIFFANLLIIH